MTGIQAPQNNLKEEKKDNYPLYKVSEKWQTAFREGLSEL